MKLDSLLKIDRIFKNKKWTQETHNEFSLYQRAINLYEILDQEEQDVLLYVLENMEYFTINDYENLLATCLIKMLEEHGDKKTYKFLPILQEVNKPALKIQVKRKNNEFNKPIGKIDTFFQLRPRIDTFNRILDVKSAMLATYLLKSNTLQYNDKLSKMKIVANYYYPDTEIKKINNRNQILVLIDDFIGTGDSAMEAINSLIDSGLGTEKIKVVSLISLQAGYKKLKDNNIEIYTGSVVKSVTDLLEKDGFNESDIKGFKETIMRISGKISNSPEKNKNNLGFGESFALVSMIRTPNNAPSFLWDNKNNDNSMVMFPRF